MVIEGSGSSEDRVPMLDKAAVMVATEIETWRKTTTQEPMKNKYCSEGLDQSLSTVCHKR